MIVKVLKPFKDNNIYRRVHACGDVIALPEAYAKSLMKNKLVAEAAEKDAKVSSSLPKPPDLGDVKDEKTPPETKDDGNAPQNKGKGK